MSALLQSLFWWFPLRLLRGESGYCFWRETWGWIKHERNKGRKSYRSHRVQRRCVCRQNIKTRRKPLKNGLFRSRYSSVTHSIDRKPRDWGLARSAYRPSGDVPCASADMACGYWFSKWRTTKSFVFLWPVWLNRVQLGMVWKISDPCTSYISKLSVTVKMWWRHKWYNGRGSASVAVAEAP